MMYHSRWCKSLNWIPTLIQTLTNYVGLQKGAEIKVNKRCLVYFFIGITYKDEVWCDVAPMDACHLLLGRPWHYDRRVHYDGYRHTYSFVVNGKKIILALLQPFLETNLSKQEGSVLLPYNE